MEELECFSTVDIYTLAAFDTQFVAFLAACNAHLLIFFRDPAYAAVLLQKRTSIFLVKLEITDQ